MIIFLLKFKNPRNSLLSSVVPIHGGAFSEENNSRKVSSGLNSPNIRILMPASQWLDLVEVDLNPQCLSMRPFKMNRPIVNTCMLKHCGLRSTDQVESLWTWHYYIKNIYWNHVCPILNMLFVCKYSLTTLHLYSWRHSHSNHYFRNA